MSANQILLFDFEDSFTHNIAAEIYSSHKNIQVIHYQKFDETIEKLSSHEKVVIILGPGPGHPEQYQSYLSRLNDVYDNPNWMMVGICLGHQITLRKLGLELNRCVHPVHGQSQKMKIPAWPIFDRNNWDRSIDIQFYNSLAIKNDFSFLAELYEDSFVFTNDNEEILLSYFPKINLLTYQFHPESLGTSYPKVFFAPLLIFLYN